MAHLTVLLRLPRSVPGLLLRTVQRLSVHRLNPRLDYVETTGLLGTSVTVRPGSGGRLKCPCRLPSPLRAGRASGPRHREKLITRIMLLSRPTSRNLPLSRPCGTLITVCGVEREVISGAWSSRVIRLRVPADTREILTTILRLPRCPIVRPFRLERLLSVLGELPRNGSGCDELV